MTYNCSVQGCVLNKYIIFFAFYVHVTVHRNKFLLIKSTDALISQIYFVKKLYMFRAVSLPIIGRFPLYIRHWCMSCRFDDCFQARLRWNRVPSKSCLKAVTKPAWHIPVPNVQWKPPDDGQRNCPKHVEFLEKINLGNLCVCWFYLKDIFRRLFQSFQVLTVKGLDHFLPYQSQFIIRSTCHSVIRPS